MTCSLVYFLLTFSAQDVRGLPPDEPTLAYFFTLYSQADGKMAPSMKDLEEFVTGLSERRPGFKSEKAFLHHTFQRARQRFLVHFDEKASFRDVIERRTYNCLGGTALYALLLHHFQIPFEIRETNHHIFLIAQTGQGPVLLESTDSDDGFVDRPEAIERAVRRYSEQRAVRPAGGKMGFAYSASGNSAVNLYGVLGLFHYNQAVEALNARNWKAAITFLQHSFLLHRSAKLDQFYELLGVSIEHAPELDEVTRERLLYRLDAIERRKVVKASTTLMIPLIR